MQKFANQISQNLKKTPSKLTIDAVGGVLTYKSLLS